MYNQSIFNIPIEWVILHRRHMDQTAINEILDFSCTLSRPCASETQLAGCVSNK